MSDLVEFRHLKYVLAVAETANFTSVRTDLSGRLRHVEYSLSDSRGVAVLQLINALTEWGSRYASSLPRPEAVRTLSGTIDFGSRDCESSFLRLQKVLLGSR